MYLEIYETMQIKCKVEESAGTTTCPEDAFAIAHFKHFGFDGNEIFLSPGAESVVPVCPGHRRRLENKFREAAENR